MHLNVHSLQNIWLIIQHVQTVIIQTDLKLLKLRSNVFDLIKLEAICIW